MNRYLLRVLVSVLFITISASVFSQVKLFDSGVTKFYDDGSRITYFEVKDFPNSEEMREYVKKNVLENTDIMRVVIYRSGKTIMYEAKQSVEPEMVVDAINDVLLEYMKTFGEFAVDDGPNSQKTSNTRMYKTAEENIEVAPGSYTAVPVERVHKSSTQKSMDNINTK